MCPCLRASIFFATFIIWIYALIIIEINIFSFIICIIILIASSFSKYIQIIFPDKNFFRFLIFIILFLNFIIHPFMTYTWYNLFKIVNILIISLFECFLAVYIIRIYVIYWVICWCNESYENYKYKIINFFRFS